MITRPFATSPADARSEEARLYPLRDAYLFETLGQVEATWGDPTTPNPPYGAVFTYSVGQPPAGDSRLVLTITDDAGKQIRRIDLSKDTGVHRIAWDLHGEAPNASGGGRGGRGGAGSDSPDAPASRWPWTSERSAGHTWKISCDDRKNDWRHGHPDRSAAVVCGGAAAKLAGRPRHGDAQDYPVTRIVMRSFTAPFAFAPSSSI